jgi:hypothetical protein
MLQVLGKIQGVNATAYAARHSTGYKIALFNKDEQKAVEVSLRMPRKANKATAWRLQAPALDATEGVTLAGAAIGAHAAWTPRVTESVSIRKGIPRIHIPPASAALVFVS